MKEDIPELVVKHYEQVNIVVQSLKESLENSDVEGRIKVAERAEEDADFLRRKIVKLLVEKEVDAKKRSPIYRLVLHTEDIADQAIDACKLLALSKELDIPPEIIPDLRKMAVFAAQASLLLYSSLENLWADWDKAIVAFSQIRDIEKTVDDLEMEVRRKSISTSCGVWEAVLLWRIFTSIERVVDRIEDASDEAESIIVIQG